MRALLKSIANYAPLADVTWTVTHWHAMLKYGGKCPRWRTNVGPTICSEWWCFSNWLKKDLWNTDLNNLRTFMTVATNFTDSCVRLLPLVLHPVTHLSNWFLVTPSIATKFQYVTPPFLFSFTHYMFRPLQAILKWGIQLDVFKDYFYYIYTSSCVRSKNSP
jgi:hypothetical protein